MDKLRIGIVGCGGIANQKHLPALAQLKDECEVVAFCDIIVERAEKAAREYGTADAKVYKDYQELLKDESIDIVYVLTPNVMHSPITVAAFEAGKHVLCEKPMAHTTEAAQAMLDAWKKSGKKFTIGYQNRFRQEVQTLYKSCRNDELGEIYFAKAHAVRRRAVPTWGVFPDKSQQGGGPLIDIGTHALDLTLWMMNNYKPKTVLGAVYHKLGQRENAANAFGPWDPKKFTVEDSAFGFITMEDGASIMLEASWALNTLNVGEAKTTLHGTEAGADMWDGLRINGERFSKLYVNKIETDMSGVAFFDGKRETEGEREARMWIESIVNDRSPLVLPEQALVVTQILEAIYESARTGKAVTLA